MNECVWASSGPFARRQTVNLGYRLLRLTVFSTRPLSKLLLVNPLIALEIGELYCA